MLGAMQISKASSKRARRSRAEWIKEVRSYRASGQGAEEYAAAHNLNAGTLCGWASKLGKEGARPSSTGRFLPVRIARAEDARASRGPASEIEVVLCNGRRVRIAGEVPREGLAELLALVEGGSRC